MKTIFDVNYQGHSIQVKNKWNDCVLMINGAVVDSTQKILALRVHLTGNVMEKNIKIDFTVGEEGYLLLANGEIIAKKDMFGRDVEL